MQIDLNADAGESFGDWRMGEDERLFPLLSTVNVACGFHAGDPTTMLRTVTAARAHGLAVGAHPGYPDLVGFGRRAMAASAEQVYADVLYQVGALAAVAGAVGLRLSHVKAHGALSHASWHDDAVAAAIAQATRDHDPALPVLVLPGTAAETQARALGVPVLLEAFPERAYLRSGQLAPRSMPGAVIHDPDQAARRAVAMARDGRVESVDGGWVELHPDSLCVHGDNPAAVAIADAVRNALQAEGIRIAHWDTGAGAPR